MEKVFLKCIRLANLVCTWSNSYARLAYTMFKFFEMLFYFKDLFSCYNLMNNHKSDVMVDKMHLYKECSCLFVLQIININNDMHFHRPLHEDDDDEEDTVVEDDSELTIDKLNDELAVSFIFLHVIVQMRPFLGLWYASKYSCSGSIGHKLNYTSLSFILFHVYLNTCLKRFYCTFYHLP